MGKCKICGKNAGWFRNVHKECQNQPLFVASTKSKKFHKPTCRFAKGELENLHSFDEAVQKNYVACKVCKP